MTTGGVVVAGGVVVVAGGVVVVVGGVVLVDGVLVAGGTALPVPVVAGAPVNPVVSAVPAVLSGELPPPPPHDISSAETAERISTFVFWFIVAHPFLSSTSKPIRRKKSSE